jgi:hypothetical protein
VKGWTDWLAASGADYHHAFRALAAPVVASVACSKRVCERRKSTEEGESEASSGESSEGVAAAAMYIVRASGAKPSTVPRLQSWILQLYHRVRAAQATAQIETSGVTEVDVPDTPSKATFSAAAQLRFARAWVGQVRSLNPRFVLRTGYIRKLIEAVEQRNGERESSEGEDIHLRAAWSLLRCPFSEDGDDTARDCPGEKPHGEGQKEGGRKWIAALEQAKQGLGGLSAHAPRKPEQTSCGGQ